jgi:Spy/CpxP family protein refolding chaperone
MTKKPWVLAAVVGVSAVVCFGLFSCVSRHSADRMSFGRMYRMNMLFDELGVTVEQRAALKQLFSEHRKDLQPSVEEVRARGGVLADLIMAETPDQEAIRKVSGELGGAIGEAAVKASMLAKEARSILTPEQVEKAKALRQRRQNVFRETLRERGSQGNDF